MNLFKPFKRHAEYNYPGEVSVYSQESPIAVEFWEDELIQRVIIDRCFMNLESEAFKRDFVILGPVHLAAEQASNAVTYLVTLSAPMLPIEEWEHNLLRLL